MSTNHLHENLGPGLLEEVAPDVFSYVQPDGTWFINNTGFIVGHSGVASIDTTSTERRNRAYIDAIASVTSQPVTLLVNTHHHADHTHGNYLFPQATIISHTSCREVMLATGIPDYRAAFPAVEWGDLEFRAPDITFEGATTIHLDDLTIDLFDLGFVAHTDGDILAWLPDRGVLFTGDLIFHGGTPFALFGSVQGTLDALDVIENQGADVIVPGHGPAFAGSQIKEVLNSQRAYLQFVQEAAKEGVSAGRTPVEQASRTELGEFHNLTDSERLAGNLHVAYRENPDADYEWVGFETAIRDMIVFNGGKLPHCLA
ncbi:MAG: MBL fold metallo-hydrolase [Actinomycetota bacterium]|jgi:cyclase|nr:MBL fold metallo-hydrolase [Actinomycetota bacterium]MEC9058651.1 MBL fold metallo-hydrolase [Actinomycetota bacterium]MEC9473672.1 MBL fold metallo-hydrolase [Actinomycetota bacterium]MED5360953.1 MBL fold metallo-hydrolase [Actinomycetota bacterium]MEE3256870.1 MBL fold metallo-hydrolase [Actinomycetota bacterium]